jgi:hypothetical protein
MRLVPRKGLWRRLLTFLSGAFSGRLMQLLSVPTWLGVRRDLASVRTYCMFLGYPRSGHSLIGSLLNAHRHVVISHELDALRYVGTLSRGLLFSAIIRRDRRFGEGGRKWSRVFTSAVEGQWQGKWEELRVIGDKKGGISTRRLESDPELLNRLRATVGCPLRILHIVRNPFDNIATICGKLGLIPEEGIEQYRRLCVTNAAVLSALAPGELHESRYEDFTAEPERRLAELCAFLGVDCPADYAAACAAIVVRKLSYSRRKIAWTGAQQRAVEEIIAAHPFLKGYTFEIPPDEPAPDGKRSES